MTGRRFGSVRPACLVLAAAIACNTEASRVAPSNTLTVLFAGDEWIFQPADYEYPTIMFEPLVSVSADGTLEGRLARHWELAPDGRTWKVQLRTDVRWHDGVPVTAHDVKFTLDLLSHPDVAQIVPDAFSFTLIDDSTYTITFHKPAIGHPLDDDRVYYPRHLLKDLDPADVFKWEFWTQPIGNGPYRYVRHIPKTMIEFEANPDYYRGRSRRRTPGSRSILASRPSAPTRSSGTSIARY